MGSAVKLAHID